MEGAEISANRSKTFSSGCLLVILLFCVVGTVALKWYQKTTACFNDRPPLRSFVVTIGRYQQRWLIKSPQEFADKNGFKFDLSYFDQRGRDFLIAMRRKDVEVLILNNIIDLEKFDVGFYNYDCIHPTVASDIDDVVSDLKSLINDEIPNATITDEK